jgi:hypothetical protein
MSAGHVFDDRLVLVVVLKSVLDPIFCFQMEKGTLFAKAYYGMTSDFPANQFIRWW